MRQSHDLSRVNIGAARCNVSVFMHSPLQIVVAGCKWGRGRLTIIWLVLRVFSVTFVAPDFALPCPYAIGDLPGKIINTL